MAKKIHSQRKIKTTVNKGNIQITNWKKQFQLYNINKQLKYFI